MRRTGSTLRSDGRVAIPAFDDFFDGARRRRDGGRSSESCPRGEHRVSPPSELGGPGGGLTTGKFDVRVGELQHVGDLTLSHARNEPWGIAFGQSRERDANGAIPQAVRRGEAHLPLLHIQSKGRAREDGLEDQAEDDQHGRTEESDERGRVRVERSFPNAERFDEPRWGSARRCDETQERYDEGYSAARFRPRRPEPQARRRAIRAHASGRREDRPMDRSFFEGRRRLSFVLLDEQRRRVDRALVALDAGFDEGVAQSGRRALDVPLHGLRGHA